MTPSPNPPCFPQKKRVAARFGKALHTYDREASAQREIAEKMLTLLHTHLQTPPSRIIEFGCGTGIFTRLLYHQFAPDFLYLNDLSPAMESCFSEFPSDRVTFHCGDAEKADFPTGVDLITSCSTLQWFYDLPAFFKACKKVLNPGGYLAFTTFGPQNLREIKQLIGRGLVYAPLDALQNLLAQEYELVYSAEELLSLTFSSPMDVLYHLKRTGVTAVDAMKWTPGTLRTFCTAYIASYGNHGQVPLTFHPIYLVVRKK